MLTSISTAVHKVRSQADPFLSLIDQQFTFFKKQPMTFDLLVLDNYNRK